jgi:hypothetical protein
MVIFQILFFLNINQEASIEDNYLTIFIRAFVAIFSRLNYKDAQVNKDSISDEIRNLPLIELLIFFKMFNAPFPINKKPRIHCLE